MLSLRTKKGSEFWGVHASNVPLGVILGAVPLCSGVLAYLRVNAKSAVSAPPW